MARLYISVLALGEQSNDATLLKNGVLLNKPDTDFGDVVFEVMRNRSKETSSCKVNDINNFLDKLSSGNKGNAEFSKIFSKLTAIEHKWLSRIILKNLGLDLSEQAILAVLHPKAPDMFNRLNSLEKICEILESSHEITDELISSLSVEPLVPIRPQLCDRMSEKQINELIGKAEMFAETKMDGERVQLHKKGDDYRYFTRNSNDCSVQFGVDSSSGCFTPLIQNSFKIPVTDVILDGEMMVWDKIELRFVVKGENVAARTTKNHEKYQSCYVVYDLLYLNGSSMIHKGYQERINMLNMLFDNEPGKLMKVRREKVRSCIQVLEVLNNAIDEQEEGIVLKQIDAVYSPGERGYGWFKVKPDYLGNLISDLDLVIIGGTYKKGRIHKYFVAIKDEKQVPTKYITVTPIVNNLSYDDSKVLHDALHAVMKPFVNTIPPAHLDFGKYIPDVYIEPKDSVILEIKASELQKSSSVSTGFILRFPRVTQIRKDKPPTDCCTLSEFQNLCGSKSGSDKVVKLPKRHATASDLTATHKRIPKRQKIDPTSTSVSRYSSLCHVEILDEIAKGLKIAVLSSGKGKNFPPKEELETLVRKHGGQVVAIPGRDTNFCVAHTETPMVRAIMQNRSQTIVTVPWFLKAFTTEKGTDKELPEITRKDTLCMKPEFEAGLRYKYDEYDDHYTKQLSKDELKQQLEDMDDVFLLFTNECNELETMIMERKEIYNIFRGQLAYFDTELYTSVDYKIAKLVFIARSGKIANDFESLDESDVVKMVVDRNDLEKLEKSKLKITKQMKGSFQLIDYQYYLQISKGLTPDQKDYFV